MSTGFKGILDLAADTATTTQLNHNRSLLDKMPNADELRNESRYLYTDSRQGIDIYLDIHSVKVHLATPPFNEIYGTYYNIRQGEAIACSIRISHIRYNIETKETWFIDNNKCKRMIVDGDSMVARGNRSAANRLFRIAYGKDFYESTVPIGSPSSTTIASQIPRSNSRNKDTSRQQSSNFISKSITKICSVIHGLLKVVGSIYGLVLYIIIPCSMIYGCFFYDSNTNHTKKSEATTSTLAETQKSVPPIQPIAKANVNTGYDTSKPLLNDDGLCELTVDNSQNDMPVYVRIWDMNSYKPVRAFYISSGDEFTAYNLTPSIYEVRYIELYDNDFPTLGSKSEQFSLEQITDAFGIQYSQMSLTLYKVRNGNTHTIAIPADQI